MKTVFVVSLLFALAASDTDMEKKFHECDEETGLTLSEVTEYLLGDDAENDEKATKYMMCMFKQQGAIDGEGHLDMEKVRLSVNNYMKTTDAADDKEALECVEEKDTAEETALAVGKCVEKRRAELTSSK
uniref:Minus-C odorant binding protein 1 n=1 Tax=Batocera horsfieldi TaxID=351105 RepID=D4P5A7_9CUCU|nr:minus-C odorant binding protein 1 [Batocera horsfieldi]